MPATISYIFTKTYFRLKENIKSDTVRMFNLFLFLKYRSPTVYRKDITWGKAVLCKSAFKGGGGVVTVFIL